MKRGRPKGTRNAPSGERKSAVLVKFYQDPCSRPAGERSMSRDGMIDDSRPHIGAGVLRDQEGARAQQGEPFLNSCDIARFAIFAPHYYL
jgi:hypothetical protein